MNHRAERRKAYLKDGGIGFLSTDIVKSALGCLSLALADRRGHGLRLKHNHYAPNATGALVLLVTALDASMNELIAFVDKDRPLADVPTLQRYLRLTQGRPPDEELYAHLGLLVEVRHEVVHFLPRYVGDKGNVPTWLKPLDDLGLFLRGPREEVDFTFFQKLSSYALAYWGWEVANAILKRVVEAIPAEELPFYDYLTHNFGRFDQLCAPADLPTFDRRHGLTLSDPPGRPDGTDGG